MARPEPTPAGSPTVTVVVPDREPYAMSDVVELTATGARVRGPLLLEVGERLRLRIARGGASAEVGARVRRVERGDGHGDATSELVFDDGSAASLASVVG